MNYLALVNNFFEDAPSGSARVAWDIARLMRDRGHTVAMLCRKQRPDDPDESRVESIRIVRFQLPRTGMLDPTKVGKQVRAGVAVGRLRLGDTRWDVVHSHQPIQGLMGLELCGKGARQIYTVHSSAVLEQKINWLGEGFAGRIKWWIGRGPIRRLERSVLLRMDRIHALSQYTRSLMEQYHALGRRVTVIPHWVRPEWQRQHDKSEARRLLGWPVEAPVLFTLRRHVPRMGLHVAVDAIAPLAAKGRCVFVIGGDGPLRAALQSKARQLGASDRQVIFPGRLSDEHLWLAYQAADLFVLPTIALECFGLIVQEAMAFGCPVLGTTVGSIPELIGPISPEFLVPAGDAAAMAEKVAAFLAGRLIPPSIDQLIQYIENNYSRQRILPKLMQMLQDADDGGKTG